MFFNYKKNINDIKIDHDLNDIKIEKNNDIKMEEDDINKKKIAIDLENIIYNNDNNKEIEELSGSSDDQVNLLTSKKSKKKLMLELNMNIIENEEQLNNYLDSKLIILQDKLKILQKKYSNYKIWYDRLNIMIIVISSILSIIEASRNELHYLAEDDKIWEIIFNMVPISISTFLTGTAAIIQFQKYQEKMENMQFTKEKVILASSKLKYIKEMILFHDNFDKVKKKYFEDIYTFYDESNCELLRQLLSDATEEKK